MKKRIRDFILFILPVNKLLLRPDAIPYVYLFIRTPLYVKMESNIVFLLNLYVFQTRQIFWCRTLLVQFTQETKLKGRTTYINLNTAHHHGAQRSSVLLLTENVPDNFFNARNQVKAIGISESTLWLKLVDCCSCVHLSLRYIVAAERPLDGLV